MKIINYFSKLLTQYKNRKAINTLNAILNDGRAIFSDFGNDVYLSDYVNNCIDRIASAISKIDVRSVLERPGNVSQLNDDITRLFRFKPNPLQTSKDFLAS